MTHKITMYYCPDCGSEDVEELIQVWENPNTGELNTKGDVPSPTSQYCCNDCIADIPSLDKKEVEVDLSPKAAEHLGKVLGGEE